MIVAAGLVLGAVCYFGYPVYRGWQADRAVRLAKSFLEKRNIRSGVLSVQTALRHRPDHLEAHRVAASLLEASGSPAALLHRRRLMELQPQRLEAKLEFARSALKFNNPQAAEKALDAIQEQDRKAPEFLELQAELFLAGGRADKAAANYRELLALNPGDRGARVKLAVVDLQVGSEQERASAREMLESLVSDGEFGLTALRALTRDAFRRQDFPAALSWSGRLSEMPSAEFSDEMLRLQALFSAKSPEYESWLLKVERRASEDPRFAFELGRWKVAGLGHQKAVAWLESMPKSVRDVASHRRARCGLL